SAERLRDESIYAALKAGNKCPGVSYTEPNGSVSLEVYEDQPHVFQALLPTPAANQAINNLGRFVHDAIEGSSDLRSFTARTIAADGKTEDITDKIIEQVREQWEVWEARLGRTSLKERLEEATETYMKYIQTDRY
ncbi:hypothetical protein EC973_003450, partial [Apophysomyces ossiformis]